MGSTPIPGRPRTIQSSDLAHLHKQLAVVLGQLADAESEVSRLQEELDSGDELQGKMLSRVAEVEAQLRDAEDRGERVNQQGILAEEKALDLVRGLEAEMAARDAAEAKVEALQAELAEAQRMAALRSHHELATQRNLDDLNEQKAATERELAEARSDIVAMLQEQAETNHVLASLRDELEAARSGGAEAEALRGEAERARAGAARLAEELEAARSLGAELEPLRGEAERERARAAQLAEELDAARSEAAAHRKELVDAGDALARITDELARATAELAKQNATVAELEARTAEHQDARTEALAEVKQAHQESMERMRAARQALMAEARTAHEAELEKVRALHDEQLAHVRSEHDTSFTELRAELEEKAQRVRTELESQMAAEVEARRDAAQRAQLAEVHVTALSGALSLVSELIAVVELEEGEAMKKRLSSLAAMKEAAGDVRRPEAEQRAAAAGAAREASAEIRARRRGR